jgi:histidinol-phosphate/aromatic aminotransferase/cobyric acid decarboxylase-like protein
MNEPTNEPNKQTTHNPNRSLTLPRSDILARMPPDPSSPPPSDVTKSVYGLYYPETRHIVETLWSQLPHSWYERNHTKHQDAMHYPYLAAWRAWAGAAGVTLGDAFTHEYPTAGANEAIHALLALHAARGGRRVHVFAGEYEGYSHLAAALGLEIVAHSREPLRYRASIAQSARANDQFWLSQPSAIDGNLWPGFDAFRDWLVDGAPGVALIVDLTYVGATAIAPRVELRSAPVAAAVWSLSKPFGVYYHRVGGVVSRAEIPTLRGHLWFKNLFSLHLGERLMAAHPARELPARYRDHQRRALETCRANGQIAAAAQASDVVMLAHAPKSNDGGAAHAEYARGETLRFCMSPLLDRMINP